MAENSLCEIYDLMMKEIKSGEYQTVDCRRVLDTISLTYRKLTDVESLAHSRNIQAIILHYDRVTGAGAGGGICKQTPFRGTKLTESGGIVYKWRMFPPVLQQLIAAYVFTQICESST